MCTLYRGPSLKAAAMLYNSPQRKYDLHLIPSIRSNVDHNL